MALIDGTPYEPPVKETVVEDVVEEEPVTILDHGLNVGAGVRVRNSCHKWRGVCLGVWETMGLRRLSLCGLSGAVGAQITENTTGCNP